MKTTLALLVAGLFAAALPANATTYAFRVAAAGIQPSVKAPPATPAPVLSLSAATLTLSSSFKATPATPQTITVTNSGNADLSITSAALSGANAADFSVSGCGAVVPAGGTCTLIVGFTPAGTATETAQLTLTSNAASPNTVSLTGTNTGLVDPYLANVTFLSHLDSASFTDLKGNAITNTGSVTWSATGGLRGSGAAVFNGSNRLSATSASAFTFGTGDFTVEASLYMTTAAGTGGNCASIVGDGALWQLCPSMTYIGWWNAAVGATRTWNYTFATNTWYNFAVTRSAGTLRMYVNGTLLGSVADATNMTASGLISIGNVTALGQPVKGLVDDVRVTKGVARYTGSSYTPAAFGDQ